MIWDTWTDIILIYSTSALALIWASFNAMAITSIEVEDKRVYDDEEKKSLKDKRD